MQALYLHFIHSFAIMKETVYNIIQLSLSVLLIVVILLQQKGAGLSGIFGGSSNVYSTKRGVDKFLHWGTIILSVIFFGVALLRLI
jgi:protein translocase SecG subunit